MRTLLLALLLATPSTPTLTAPAVASRPAHRIDPPRPTETEAVAAGSVFGPFAPDGLDGCDEMSFYRQQAGLPERFDQIGYRESRCTNAEHVHTWCCWGYWQAHFAIHMADHRMGPRYAACGVDHPSDYNGGDPLDKQKQACVTRALFDLSGYQPWGLR